MAKADQARNRDVEAIVVQSFQDHLGVSEDLPLASRLYDDLGLESITLVAALLDIADHLQLDLEKAQVDLNAIETLEEVVSLVRAIDCSDAERAT